METFAIEQFGGLDVITDPFDVGARGATAMNNVDFGQRGAIVTRPGTTDFATFDQATPASNPYSILHDGINGHLIGTAGSNTYAISVFGSQVTSAAFSIITEFSIADFGTPTAQFSFMAPLTGGVLRRYDGSAFSTPVYTGTQPTGLYVGVTPVSNRLVNFGISGSPGRVIFSEPQDPLTFPANNFVDIGSGGSDRPYAAKQVNNMLVLIGPERIISFYGESVDSDGNPVFNYNSFNAPWRDAGMGQVVSGPNAVYVLTSTGLWMTAGGDATLVSDALNPLIKGLQSPALSLNGSGAYSDGRLYFSAATGSIAEPDWVLVYDLKQRMWLTWNFVHRTLVAARNQRVPRVYVSRRTGTTPNRVARFDPAATTDGGTAIPWSYTTGKYRLAEDPNRVAITDYSALTGSGTVTLRIDSDLYTNQSGSATLGTAPATAEGFPPTVDQEGSWVQSTLSGTSAGTVAKLLHNVTFVKPAGTR